MEPIKKPLPRHTNGRFMKKKYNTSGIVKKNKSKGKIYTPAPFIAWSGHRVVDMQSLADGLWCKVCDTPLSLRHCVEELRKGIASTLKVLCQKCGTARVIDTSPDHKAVKDLVPGDTQKKVVTRNETVKPAAVETPTRPTIYRTYPGKKSKPPAEPEKDPLDISEEIAVPDSPEPSRRKTRLKEATSNEATNKRGAASTSYDADFVVQVSDLEDSDLDFAVNDVDDDDVNDKDWIMDEKMPTSPLPIIWQVVDEDPFVEKPNPSGEVFCCEYCDQKYNTKRRCMQHMREDHPEFNNLICAWCKRKCVSDAAFRSHRRSHRGEAGCMCETCGKRCRNVKHLELHKLDHLPDELARRFACSVCGKRYKTEAYVLKHENLHTADRAFICDQCPKKFLTKQRLEEHMQLHTGEFKFLCEICSAKFTRKDNMTQHIKQNHRYVCPLCNCTFTTAEDVKSHRNDAHTREEIEESESDGHAPFYKYTDFQCNFCHRFLASKQSLNFHIATHTGEGRKRSNASKKDKMIESSNNTSCIIKSGNSFNVESNVPEPEVQIHEQSEQQSCEVKNQLPPRDETLLATYNLIRVAIDQT